MADETILREREHPTSEEGLRGGHPPGIQSLLNLLADNRYLTAEETDKIINYLRERKERQLRANSTSLPASLPRQSLQASSGTSLTSSASLPSSQTHQSNQALPSSASTAAVSNPQQELQAKILSLFNSGAAAAAAAAVVNSSSALAASQNTSFAAGSGTPGRSAQLNVVAGLPQSQQRAPAQGPQFPTHPGAGRGAGPRAAAPQSSQSLYQNRVPVSSNVAPTRPIPPSGINFDNPSVQKALDTLIQSGPALTHLVNQTVAQARSVPPNQQQSLGSYQRHY